MPPHEDSPGEVVKPFSTVLTSVSSACLLAVVATALGDFVGRAARTTHPVGPTFPSDFFVTFTFIDEVVEAAHGGQAQGGRSSNFITSSKPNMSHPKVWVKSLRVIGLVERHASPAGVFANPKRRSNGPLTVSGAQ
jgi:hypothetical protein